jgi:hypothetical protein
MFIVGSLVIFKSAYLVKKISKFCSTNTSEPCSGPSALLVAATGFPMFHRPTDATFPKAKYPLIETQPWRLRVWIRYDKTDPNEGAVLSERH